MLKIVTSTPRPNGTNGPDFTLKWRVSAVRSESRKDSKGSWVQIPPPHPERFLQRVGSLKPGGNQLVCAWRNNEALYSDGVMFSAFLNAWEKWLESAKPHAAAIRVMDNSGSAKSSTARPTRISCR